MTASSMGKPSAGSALLCDMTAFEHYVICLNGNGRLTPCPVHHVLYVTSAKRLICQRLSHGLLFSNQVESDNLAGWQVLQMPDKLTQCT